MDALAAMTKLQGDGDALGAIGVGAEHLKRDPGAVHVAYLVAALSLDEELPTEFKLNAFRQFFALARTDATQSSLYAAETLRQSLYLRQSLTEAEVRQLMTWALRACANLGSIPQTVNLDELAWCVTYFGDQEIVSTLISLAQDEETRTVLARAGVAGGFVDDHELTKICPHWETRSLMKWGDPISGVRWHQVTDPYAFELAPLHRLPKESTEDGIMRVTVKSEGLRFASFFGAEITGGSSLVVHSTNDAYCDYLDFPSRAIADPGPDSRLVCNTSSRAVIRTPDGRIEERESGISLLGPVAMEHGHLLPDTLPKLAALEDHGEFSDLPVFVDESANARAIDFLSRFITRERINVVANRQRIRVRRLLLPLPPIFSPPHVRDWARLAPGCAAWDPQSFLFVRNRLLKPEQPTNGSRIFVVRDRSNGRRSLANQDELLARAEEFGFQAVDPGNYDISDQIGIFARASHVIVQAGAATYNLVVANRSARVAVLIGSHLFHWPGVVSAISRNCSGATFVCGDSHERPIPDWQVPFRVDRSSLDAVLQEWFPETWKESTD